MKSPEKINIFDEANQVKKDWKSFIVSENNDHAIRINVLDRDFHWHKHPNSDETFLCIDGELWIDFEEKTELLKPGEMITVPKGTLHRTRAKRRNTNVTFVLKETDVKGGT